VRITDDDIRKFREIWREEFAEEIAAEEAREHITRLDTLYLLLARQPAQGTEPAASRSEDIPHQ
jgi:RNA binding exosome subunit